MQSDTDSDCGSPSGKEDNRQPQRTRSCLEVTKIGQVLLLKMTYITDEAAQLLQVFLEPM